MDDQVNDFPGVNRNTAADISPDQAADRKQWVQVFKLNKRKATERRK